MDMKQFEGRITITLPEAARVTGLDKRTISSRIRTGLLKATRLPGKGKHGMWLIDFESFKKLVTE